MGSDGTKGIPGDVPIISDAREHRGLTTANPAKEMITAEQLAVMIHQDLSQVDGCPQRGVTVTVYGLNPWNSMLTFCVDAGRVRNQDELQRFCDIITERLRRLYDVR